MCACKCVHVGLCVRVGILSSQVLKFCKFLLGKVLLSFFTINGNVNSDMAYLGKSNRNRRVIVQQQGKRKGVK